MFAEVLSALSTSAISAGSNSVPFTISIQSSASSIAVSFVRHGPKDGASFRVIFLTNSDVPEPEALIPLVDAIETSTSTQL